MASRWCEGSREGGFIYATASGKQPKLLTVSDAACDMPKMDLDPGSIVIINIFLGSRFRFFCRESELLLTGKQNRFITISVIFQGIIIKQLFVYFPYLVFVIIKSFKYLSFYPQHWQSKTLSASSFQLIEFY